MSVPLYSPPRFALVTSLVILTVGAMTGAVLISFQDIFYAWAREEIIRRPEIHGFAGSEVIDQARITEIADQSNTALRLLHTHAIGVGMLILLATHAITNLPIAARHQLFLCGLVSLGCVYPLGWLVLAWLIPFVGVDDLQAPIQWIFFAPFGSALILGLLGTLGFLFVGLFRRSRTKTNEREK
jgi:hypothetical protein